MDTDDPESVAQTLSNRLIERHPISREAFYAQPIEVRDRIHEILGEHGLTLLDLQPSEWISADPVPERAKG